MKRKNIMITRAQAAQLLVAVDKIAKMVSLSPTLASIADYGDADKRVIQSITKNLEGWAPNMQ